MSLTSAMRVGFTGIDSNTTAVDTVGNNLANLNTTAFKGQRSLFETLLYRTLSEGEPPNATNGGTLPRQIGFGSRAASLQRSFRQGGLDATGVQSDLGIQGDGFFILAGDGGETLYTRDGSFRLDADQTLVSASNAPVQGFAADPAGTIDESTLSRLVIPLGSTGEAVATREVVLDGRLDGSTDIADRGAVLTSQVLAMASGAPATADTALTDLVDSNGLELFSTGDELTVGGAKGGITVEASPFVVGTTGRTLGDLARHLEQVLGIVPGGAGAAAAPGVTVSDGSDFPAGALVIRSNPGEINAVELDRGSITNATGVAASPFSFSVAAPARGGGITTSFGVFDSLGRPVDVRLRMVLESRSETGTTWRFYAESNGDSDLSPALGTGTVTFDANGRFVAATGADVSIDRAGAGSVSPLSLALDFSGVSGLAAPDGASELVMDRQDGAPAGLLVGYSIDADGIVTGTFSNQRTKVLGQVALARFANNEGLLARSENTFTVGPNSGDVTVVAPQTSGAGAVVEGTLEQSNVEIAREFVNLITASTGISTAGRVVRVADDLLQELLLIAR